MLKYILIYFYVKEEIMKNFHVFGGGIDAEHVKTENSSSDGKQHCHDKYEILYVIEGEGRCLIEGVQYPIKPRTVFVFSPLVYHAIYLDEGCIYDRTSVYFEERAVCESVADILKGFGKANENASHVAFYRADALSDEIALLFERFEISESFPENERARFLGLLTSELILFVSMSSREDVAFDDRELGARVISYLNEYAGRDISLDKLARRFFVSKYYLCRAFKKHNGISVRGYINRKRIMCAKQLIDAGETASRAAYQVGYGDYSAFYRAYVKLVGKSPTE